MITHTFSRQDGLQVIYLRENNKFFVHEPGSIPEEFSDIEQVVSQKEKIKEKQVLNRLVLILTTECNLRCRYCYADGGNYGMEFCKMPEDCLIRTLEWFLAKYQRINYIQFFGGEPTLAPDLVRATCEFFECRSAAGSPSPSFALVTNGVALTPVMETLIRKYNIKCTISVDGPSEVHNANRRTAACLGSHEHTIRNFATIREILPRETQIQMTFTKEALKRNVSVFALASYAKEQLRLVDPHIVPVFAENDEELGWGEYADDAVESFRNAVKQSIDSIMRQTPVTFTLFSRILRGLINNSNSEFVCGAGDDTLAVDVYGNVYPCFIHAGELARIICNTADSPTEQEFIAKIKEYKNQYTNKKMIQKCRSCWLSRLCSSCVGGVKQLYTNTEDPLMCRILKAIAEETMLCLAEIYGNEEKKSMFFEGYKVLKTNPI